MTSRDIIRLRLSNQQIGKTKFQQPQEIVSWLVAMQAQEYAMAKWSIGLRLGNTNDAAVEKKFNEGSILRTHLMRPTWHFVTPADIRWMLQLTAPRVNAANAFMYRKLDLDVKIFTRSNHIIAKTLEGGKYLTREKLKSALQQKKIGADGLRLGYIMMHAELDGIICSGPREGKQFTYALLDERIGKASGSSHAFDKGEALSTLAMRYFRGRGPATLQDFAYWSGLTMKEAATGLHIVKHQFMRERIDGRDYIFQSPATNEKNLQTSFLMPDYDEYGMSYKDRSILNSLNHQIPGAKSGSLVYNRMIVLDGKIAGSWHRSIKNNSVAITTVPFTTLNAARQKVLEKAIQRYRKFLGKKTEHWSVV